MNSVDLAFFAAVAELGGIGKAASALNTVQSNVTARIRTLEANLRTKLFYRGARGVTLTPAGERLVPFANQVEHLLREAQQAIRAEGTPCGPLRMGSMETTAALRLPRLLTAYARRCPDVDVELELGPTEFLVSRVLERGLEVAFVAGPIQHDELAAVPVLEEELVLIAAPNFGSLRDVLAALGGRRDARALVFRAGCSYRQRLENFLVRRGLAHVRRMDFGTLDGIVGCVEAGMGVSLLPKAVAEPLKKGGRLSIHPLPGDAGRAETLMIHRRDGLVTSALGALFEEVEQRFLAAR